MPSSAKTIAFSGCISAKSGQIAWTRSSTAGSSVNARGRTPPSASISAEREPCRGRQPERPDAGRVRVLGAAGAERGADEHLRRDRERVEHEREEEPERERALVRAERRGAEARDGDAGEQERDEERGRAHGDVPAEP